MSKEVKILDPYTSPHVKQIDLFAWNKFEKIPVEPALQLTFEQQQKGLLLETEELLDGLQWKGNVLDLFYQFMYERQNIWHKRFILEQPAPWTEDPVLLQYKFTNVMRKIDRGTICLYRNIFSRLDGSERMEKLVLFNILAYRFLNKVESWEKCITFIYDWDKEKAHFVKSLNAMQKKEAVFTAAHMVPPLHGIPGDTKIEKLSVLLSEIWDDLDNYYSIIKNADNLKAVYKQIHSVRWFGRFLSYEMAVDLSYTDIIPYNEDEWTSSGPGSIRGINNMLHVIPSVKAETHPLYTAILVHLRNIQKEKFEELDLPFEKISYGGSYLTLRDIEHSTCEFLKYYRTLMGTGRCKEKFVPKSVEAHIVAGMRGV